MPLEIRLCMHGELTAPEQALYDATLVLTRQLERSQACSAVLSALERLFAARSVWLLLHDSDTDELVVEVFRGPGSDVYANTRVPCDRGIVGLAFRSRETVFVPDVGAETRWFDSRRVHQSGLQSVLTMPLLIEDETLGIVGLDSPLFSADRPPSPSDLARLKAVAAIAAAAIRNVRQLECLESDRARLRQMLEQRRELRTQVGHLREQVREARSLRAIVGESDDVRRVTEQVDVVAPTDTSVLLIGETGTGKELIARALHDRSRRAAKPFVAINCAALPESLVESELFGYEKGAFTGAAGAKPGKFELANLGTIFLDEIGDLPPQAQAKLLRVLQEREVQRIGATRTLTVNVRLIAATNQDLDAAMRDGRFRPDLYFRLSVFPIRLTPLRERREDIPALVAHFTRRFAEEQHKPVPRVSDAAMERLVSYDWPGNVRELQNVIERAVILTGGSIIRPDAITLTTPPSLSSPPTRADRGSGPAPISDAHRNVIPFTEAERHAIVRALEGTGWRISGNGGAADVLGLKPTTLHAKMKKLGIRRPSASVSRAG